MQLKRATGSEAETAMRLIDEARAYLKAQGLSQWQNGVPSLAMVEADIAAQRGYLLLADGRPAAYCCLDFAGERFYAQLNGVWRSDAPYAALHRLAVGADYRRQGCATAVFRLAEGLCKAADVHSIRVDTHEQNRPMRAALERNGYAYRGKIFYPTAGARIAFEKLF